MVEVGFGLSGMSLNYESLFWRACLEWLGLAEVGLA
jgi:hypothetical protein